MDHINFIAILVAALVPIVMRFIWYNPIIFGNAWMREAEKTEEKKKSANMPAILILSFFFNLFLFIKQEL